MWNQICEELSSIGLVCNFHTLAEFQSWVRKYKLLEPVQKLILDGDSVVTKKSDTRPVCFSDFQPSLHGTFGTLFEVFRKTPSSTSSVFLKASKQDSGQFLHIEAILQEVSRCILAYYGFPRAVPRVHDILQHPIYTICFTMEIQSDALFFSDYIQTYIHNSQQKNDTLFISILAQLATYLAILEHELCLNHRDLTGTNVLMIAPSDESQNHVQLGSSSWDLRFQHRVILIDFGFAAIGSMPNRKTILQAGSYFHQTDPCPKDGRDLFLFLASLWKNPIIRKSVSSNVRTLFHTWLTQGKKNWAAWLEASESDLTGMYLLLMKEEFKNPRTNPINLLRDIARAFPTIVTFH
jgi:serine/threonine protein kinase